MKNKYSLVNLVCLMLALFTTNALAGGLDSGTDAVSNIKVWIFTILGIAALIYLAYMIIFAFLDRKSWSDVGVALIQVICAGGALAGGTWGLSLLA